MNDQTTFSLPTGWQLVTKECYNPGGTRYESWLANSEGVLCIHVDKWIETEPADWNASTPKPAKGYWIIDYDKIGQYLKEQGVNE